MWLGRRQAAAAGRWTVAHRPRERALDPAPPRLSPAAAAACLVQVGQPDEVGGAGVLERQQVHVAAESREVERNRRVGRSARNARCGGASALDACALDRPPPPRFMSTAQTWRDYPQPRQQRRQRQRQPWRAGRCRCASPKCWTCCWRPPAWPSSCSTTPGTTAGTCGPPAAGPAQARATASTRARRPATWLGCCCCCGTCPYLRSVVQHRQPTDGQPTAAPPRVGGHTLAMQAVLASGGDADVNMAVQTMR